MMQFKPIIFNDQTHAKYWDGPSNLFVRYHNYLQRGLGLYNEFKNYIMMLFGTYWTVKTMDWWIGYHVPDLWLVGGLLIFAIVGLGFLLLAGRWHLYKAAKATEFINNRHGTVTQYDGFNMQVYSTALLEGLAQSKGVDTENIRKKLFEIKEDGTVILNTK